MASTLPREPESTVRYETKLVFYSKTALYPMHWQAFLHLCTRYQVRGTALANTPDELPSVHQQLGRVGQIEVDGVDLRFVPPGTRAAQARWLGQELRSLDPDVLWVQEEPTDYFLFQLLRRFYFRRRPRIVAAVCENIFPKSRFPVQWVKELLWRRLDGLVAVATASVDGVRLGGMPKRVPASTLVAGALPPPADLTPMALPFDPSDGDFVVGFAGRICEEKGWKLLLEALRALPPRFKCLVAGDGPQLPELESQMREGGLAHRVFFHGLLPKAELWRFYRALDCLVVPSLTRPTWKEQFGGVLADGMAVGLPLIGSDSGAIPEVVGRCGLIVPEGNANELEQALRRLEAEPDLRRQLGEAGRRRFCEEFAIAAYAGKLAKSLGLALR